MAKYIAARQRKLSASSAIFSASSQSRWARSIWCLRRWDSARCAYIIRSAFTAEPAGGDFAVARFDDLVIRHKGTARPLAYARVRRATIQLTRHFDGNRFGPLDNIGFGERRRLARFGMRDAAGVKQSGRRRAARRLSHRFAHGCHVDADDEAAAIHDGAPAHPRLVAHCRKEELVVAPAAQSQDLAVSCSLASPWKTVDRHGFAGANRMAPIGNPGRLQIGCQ